MKNVWKLSNYLYGWLWQKWTKVVTLVSMILAVCFLFAAAVPTGTAKDYDYYPKVFRSYDMVIDHSLLPILFCAFPVLSFLSGFDSDWDFRADQRLFHKRQGDLYHASSAHEAA